MFWLWHICNYMVVWFAVTSRRRTEFLPLLAVVLNVDGLVVTFVDSYLMTTVIRARVEQEEVLMCAGSKCG